MSFEFFKAFSPDEESPMVELQLHGDGIVDIPAEIRLQDGAPRITLFGRSDGAPRDFDAREWLAAVTRAIEMLEN